MELPKPAPKSGGGGGGAGAENFLNIEDGQSINVVFRGQPFLYYQSWPFGGEKETSLEPFPGAKPRYLWNAVIRDVKAKKFVAKIWDMAAPTYEILYKINSKLPLEKTKVEITRNGIGKKTKYMIIPMPGDLDERALREIEAVQLNILHREESSAEDEQEEPREPKEF